MSRSYKKQLGWVDRNPWNKNQANRRIRRKAVEYDIQNGNAYRKEFCSWNICDHKSLYFGPECLIREEISRWRWVHGKDVDQIFYAMKAK
jgi:hypothetical protein